MLDMLCNLNMLGCFLVFAGELIKEHHTEPQCSNATDSEAHLTANSRQSVEELEYYPSDCNNSFALTSELPLNDESKQWMAMDTCLPRENAVAITKMPMHSHDDVIDMVAFDGSSRHGLEQLIAHQQKMMEHLLTNAMLESIYSESMDTVKHLRKYATVEDHPCSSAHTPIAEPQTLTELGHTPAVKGIDI